MYIREEGWSKSCSVAGWENSNPLSTSAAVTQTMYAKEKKQIYHILWLSSMLTQLSTNIIDEIQSYDTWPRHDISLTMVQKMKEVQPINTSQGWNLFSAHKYVTYKVLIRAKYVTHINVHVYQGHAYDIHTCHTTYVILLRSKSKVSLKSLLLVTRKVFVIRALSVNRPISPTPTLMRRL